jgi:1-pyrroline-5-carboxylate dehydrogenase
MTFKNEDTFSMGKDKVNRYFKEALRRVEKDLGKHYPMYIAGEQAFSDEEVETVSPIDRRVVMGYFQKGKVEHARAAVQAAKEAFYGGWRDYDWKERLKIFEKAASILRRKKFEVAAILSYENGKNRGESIGEVDEAIDFLMLYPQLVRQNNGLIIDRGTYISLKKETELGHQGARSEGERVKIISKPYGVWAVIAPFNFPISISTGMCTAAMITGNTVVFKPSFGDNPTPLTGIKMYEVFTEAGLPKGVLNYISGSGSEVGKELTGNPDVKGIAFTGSRAVGLDILRKTAGFNIPKQVVAEMGSKNPAIISQSADLDMAVRGIISSAFGFCGQKCSACSRVIVHESIYGDFLRRFVERVKTLRVEDPLKEEVYMGPIIGRMALERYLLSVERAKKEGRVISGGKQLTGTELFDNGFYVEPTIIEVDPENELFKKELFLPIVAVTKYSNFKDAIKLANDTEYGLTAGLYTGEDSEKEYFNSNIEFGTTYVNRTVSASTGAIAGWQSFVGCKGSSFTCKGTSSLSYLLQFVREHSQTVVE